MDTENLMIEALKIKPFTCISRNAEIPCVVCPDEDQCEVFDDLVEFSHDKDKIKVIRCKNSSVIYYKIKFHDIIEEFLYSRLWTALRGSKKSPVGYIDPIDGYHAGILVMSDHVSTPNQKQKVKQFLVEFPNKVEDSLLQGKMSINKFIRKAEKNFFL